MLFQKNSIVVDHQKIGFSSYVKEFRKNMAFDVFKFAKTTSTQIDVYGFRYTSNGHLVNGFVILPKTSNKKFPCIIHNRGGSMEFGAIKIADLFTKIGRMASWGYVVIATQYSGNAGSAGKDEFGGKDLNDVLELRKILNYVKQADTSRIGMFGASRGGMMAYMCLARVKWLRAVVTVGGVSDLFRNRDLRPEMKERFASMFPLTNSELKKRSAIHWVNKFYKKAPVLMMHGTADWRVSPLDSMDLSREMLWYKVPHRLVLFEGADHGLTEFMDDRRSMTRAWFDRFVRDKEPLPDLKPHGK